MPPLEISPAPTSLLGYHIRFDTLQWQTSAMAYWSTIRQGSLGESRNGIPVGQLLHDKLGNSLMLLGLALVIATAAGVAKGVWDFRRIRRGRPGLGPLVTGVVQGLPDFWVAFMLQILCVQLSVHLQFLPLPVAYDEHRPIASLVYPLFCLSLIPAAYVARTTSTALAAVWDQDYIRTARAKGLTERRVLYRHALRSALVQILDGLPNALAVMFSNLLIVEYLFYLPGITLALKDAINPVLWLTGSPLQKLPPLDTPVLVAAGVSLGLIFAALYLACAMLRRLVDPRLRERDQV